MSAKKPRKVVRGAYRPPAPAWKPTGQMKREASSSMRQLAAQVQKDHPEMGMHVHLRDAANALDRGNTEGASRHLSAAIGNATPQSLWRHGIVHDQDYHQAKAHMDSVHRHLLLVKDIQDHEMHNQGLAEASRMGMDEADTGMNQVPSSRDPRAMKATDGKPPAGDDDPGIAQPKSITSWKVTKQVAASNRGDLTTAIELGFLGHKSWIEERRDRKGRWTSEDAEQAVKSLNSAFGSEQIFGGPRHKAIEHLRAGRLHEAADQIDVFAGNSATERGNKKLRALSGLLRDVHAPDDDYVHHQEAEMGLEPDPGILAAATAKSNDDLERDIGFKRFDGDHYDPQKAEAARRALLDRAILGEYHPPQKIYAYSLDNRDRIQKAHADLLSQWQKVSVNYRPEGAPTAKRPKARPAMAFSAETGRLAVTPAPRGRPGGPGLYNVKGNEHSPYFQQVVKALIEKRGMPPGKAYAIAWGALRKWRRGGGHVHPEVQAAAAGALGQEDVARARAHSHANGAGMELLLSWDEADRAIELAVLDLVGPKGWSHGFKRAGMPGFDPRPHGSRAEPHFGKTGHYEKGKWAQTQAERSRALFGPGGSPRHDFFPNATGKKGGFEAGSKEHAAHLRSLAGEADRRSVSKGGGPESEVGNKLRNAARRVEQGNYRAAKIHMVGLGNAEHREHNAGVGPGNADMHKAVHEARDSVMRLPDHGPSMAPPGKMSADEIARTKAAQAYAARTAPRGRPADQLVARNTAVSGSGGAGKAAHTASRANQGTFATSAANRARIARNRRRNAGLSNRDALAILLAGGVPGPKG